MSSAPRPNPLRNPLIQTTRGQLLVEDGRSFDELTTDVERSVEVPRDESLARDAPEHPPERLPRADDRHLLEGRVVDNIDLGGPELGCADCVEPDSALFVRPARRHRHLVRTAWRELRGPVGDDDTPLRVGSVQLLLHVVEETSENSLLASVQRQALPGPPRPQILIPHRTTMRPVSVDVVQESLEAHALGADGRHGAQRAVDAVVPGVGALDGTEDAALRVVLSPRQHEGLELSIWQWHDHEVDVDTSRIAANKHVALGCNEVVSMQARTQGRTRTVKVHAERDAVGLDAVCKGAMLPLKLLDLEDGAPLLVAHGIEVLSQAVDQAGVLEHAEQAPRVEGEEVTLDVANRHDVEQLGADRLVETVQQHVVAKHRRLTRFSLDPQLCNAWLLRCQSQRPSMQLNRLEDLPPHRERTSGPVFLWFEVPSVDCIEHVDLLVLPEPVVRCKHLAELANTSIDRRPKSGLEVRQIALRSVRVDVPIVEEACRRGVQRWKALMEPSDVKDRLLSVASSDEELPDERLVEHVGEVDVAQARVICLPDTSPHNAVQGDAPFNDLNR